MLNDEVCTAATDKQRNTKTYRVKTKIRNKKNKHNAELQLTDPGTKVMGEFSTKGHIFPPNA